MIIGRRAAHETATSLKSLCENSSCEPLNICILRFPSAGSIDSPTLLLLLWMQFPTVKRYVTAHNKKCYGDIHTT